MNSETLASFLAILHTAAAIGVTLHVLFTHRDVRSAFGWIGLSWLSPFLGSFIYFAFGINRVMRRGTRISWTLNGGKGFPLESSERLLVEAEQTGALTANTLSPNILTIADTGDQISGMALTIGNTLELLENGDAAYPPMLEAINNAENSIALASFLFADDAVGSTFVDALIAAHNRGVAVRVLLDGIGGGYLRSEVHERLQAAGVPSALFLHEWLPWKMSFINLRNHKKILVVDGQVGFTGGININQKNTSKHNDLEIMDVQARLTGPVVAHLLLTFARDWDFASGEALTGLAWWPRLTPVGTAAMRGISSGPDQSVGRIEETWVTAIEQAEKNVRILTPYFLPEDRLLALLRRAAMRGVKVEIVVPERSNHFYFNWAFDAHMDGFPLDKIDCYLTPQPFDHSKLMSVDGVWSALGSPNWDARSMRLNFEFLVECYCGDATAAIDAIIDQKIGRARKLTTQMLQSRPTWQKLRDASARLFLPYL